MEHARETVEPVDSSAPSKVVVPTFVENWLVDKPPKSQPGLPDPPLFARSAWERVKIEMLAIVPQHCTAPALERWALRRVGRQPLRREIMVRAHPLDHGPGGGDLRLAHSGRGLDVDDDGMVEIDQVVGRRQSG